MRLSDEKGLKALTSILLLIAFCVVNPVFAETFTQTLGDECVKYARIRTGNNYDTSPPLCKYDPTTCAAYLIYDHWDYGFGKGQVPENGALLVLAAWDGNSTGHVGVVSSVVFKGNGKYELRVDESNWYLDKQITKDVLYIYDKNNLKIQREYTLPEHRSGIQNSVLGSTQFVVRGFVYTAASIPNRPAAPLNLRVE